MRIQFNGGKLWKNSQKNKKKILLIFCKSEELRFHALDVVGMNFLYQMDKESFEDPTNIIQDNSLQCPKTGQSALYSQEDMFWKD